MFGLMLSMFLANLDQTIIATCLPVIARDLDGWELLSWVVSGYLITSTATTPIYGRLSDFFGRRPVLLASIAIFVVASALCALAPTMPLLVAARVLQGLGGGGLRSIAQVVIADIIPPRERGRYQGYMSTTFLVSTTLGPVLGGFFAEYLSWPWIFWINLPLGALAFAVIERQLRILPAPGARPVIDWPGAILILIAATTVMIGLSRVEQFGGWSSPRVWAPIAVSIFACAMLVFVELRAASPMLPMRLFRIPTFTKANVALFLPSMVMNGMVIIIPLDYELVLHRPADQAGLQLIALTGGMATGSFIVGHLTSSLGRAKIFPMIGGVVGASVCALIAVFGLGLSTAFDIVTVSLLGASIGWMINPTLVMAQNALHPRDMGAGVSGMTFFRSLAGAFGVAIFMTFLIGHLATGAAGVPGHEALGADLGIGLLRDAENNAIPDSIASAMAGVMQGAFTAVFWLGAALCLATAVLTISIEENPLRATNERSKAF